MSKHQVDEITNAAGTGAPDFPNGLTFGGQPLERFIAKGHSAVNAIATGVLTKLVNWNNTYSNPNLSNDEYTIPVTGWYTVTLNISFAINSNATYQMYLYKNGAELVREWNTTDGRKSFVISLTDQFNAADVLEVRAQHNGGLTTNIDNTEQFTWFSVEQLPY